MITNENDCEKIMNRINFQNMRNIYDEKIAEKTVYKILSRNFATIDCVLPF